MTSFDEELRAAYHPSQSQREQKLERAQQEIARGEHIAKLWPEQQQLVKRRILPRLKSLRQDMKQARKPREVRELNKAFSKFNGMRTVTWWHPRALALRLRMLFYVGGLFGAGLLLLALVGGLLWLLLQGVMWLLEATGGWLG